MKDQDLEARMDGPKPSPQHIDAGQIQPTPATVSDNQTRNEPRCDSCGSSNLWNLTELFGAGQRLYCDTCKTLQPIRTQVFR